MIGNTHRYMDLAFTSNLKLSSHILGLEIKFLNRERCSSNRLKISSLGKGKLA